jgi:putative CocE/NonD family hydrolase
MGTKQTYQIVEVVLLVLALLFSSIGCEREMGKLPEQAMSTESAEQTQSLTETALARAEAEELGVIIKRNVPVPMRDGTILRADVGWPDRGGPYPVLVQRSPYGKGMSDWFVKDGYIVVSQDVRGRGESEGKWEYLFRFQTHDAEDGYDTVEWATKLPGSNGKVGTLGISYPAFLQWRLAPLRPPSLVCMSACSSPAQIWDGEHPCTIRPGFRLQWLHMMAREMRRKANLPGVHTVWETQKLWIEESQKWLYWLPWLELPDDFFSYETDSLKSWLEDPHSDPLRLHKRCRDISVPNLDVVGWYDNGNNDMLLFRTMVKEAKTKVAREDSRIVIGPWGHTGLGRRFRGTIDFGPNAELDIFIERIRWFDYWLKGRQNGVDKDAPVRIFVMGDNKWRDEEYWPLRRANEKTLFIASDGHANTPGGDGKLVDKKPRSENTDSYVYDPRDPVPTPYGMGRPRPADQRPLANRQDILVYQTEPLTERIEVTGYPIVELYASSSAPDTDWLVRLIDVYPDGLALNVSHRMVRARYRDGFDKPKLIQPGKVVKYIITMRPTSNAFLPGHRIRLDITSSDFPNYDRHHNTAANQNADANLVTAKQTIYHGGEHATRIILPWVPNMAEDVTQQTKPAEIQPITQLHQAAAQGDLERVRSLISNGIDVNAKGSSGDTALHCAAQNDHKEIVQVLLANGADVNARQGEDGSTALEHAVRNKNKDLVHLLITKGADVNLSGWDYPPLVSAVWEEDKAMVELLVNHGAKFDAKNKDGWTAFRWAAAQGSRDIVEFFVSKGADVSTFHLAACMGDLTRVKSFLEQGADINAKDELGWTPLYWAASTSQTEVAEFLIAKGALVDVRTHFNSTPLHQAAQAGDVRLLTSLISKGADVNARDRFGRTPSEAAALAGHTEVAEQVIAKTINANAKDDNGLTRLHRAASSGRKDIAEMYLARGADVNIRDNNYEFTALHYAARFGNKNVAEVLIAKGADIKAKDRWDYQPIHWAAYHDRVDVVELLISKGADVNAKTSLGQTPLQLAKPRRNTATIEVLREHGAKE